MMETKLEVPSEVRELVAIGIDNAEKALALLFDNVTRSIAPNSLDSMALLRRGYRRENGLRSKACVRA
jgi:hypothetical protein